MQKKQSNEHSYKEKILGNRRIREEIKKMKGFVKYGVVLDTGSKGSWDEEGVAIPSILKINSKLWMWFQSRGHEQIGLAFSEDGFSWTKYEGNPVFRPGQKGEWDDGSVAAPMVLKEKEIYKMWYDGNRGFKDAVALGTHQIGLAYSKDGIHWKKENRNPVFGLGKRGFDNDLVVGASFVMKEKGIYFMYFDERGTGFRDGNNYQIGMAISIDGINWKQLMKPVLSTGQLKSFDNYFIDDAHIIKKRGYYIMFYEGADGKKDRKKYLGYAISLDAFNWVKIRNNMVLSPSNDSFDRINVASCWVESLGDDYVMWYSGSDGDVGDWKIGIASTIKEKSVLINKLKHI